MSLDVILALASFGAVCVAWLFIGRERTVIAAVSPAEERAA
jgi:hypothetical protein